MKLVIDVLSLTSSLSSVVGVLENMRMYKSLSHTEGSQRGGREMYTDGSNQKMLLKSSMLL